MDGFNEKKWFVYFGDHHEGPFSLEEIQTRMTQGQVTSSQFVWCEGMADWKMMTDVPVFESLAKPSAPLSAPFIDEPSLNAIEPVSNGPGEPSFTDILESAAARAPATILSGAPLHRSDESHKENVEEILEQKPRKKSSRALLWSGVLFIALGGGFALWQGYFENPSDTAAGKAGAQTFSDATRPYVMSAIEKFPSLSKYVSPIETLPDVAAEDYEELKAAAATRLATEGPRTAFALSKNDPTAPAFYVASNLPDGTSFDVYVEGISDTLLSQLSFNSRTKAVISKRLGKSGVIRFPDGKMIPRGQYQVYLVESENQPGEVKSLLASQSPVTVDVPLSLPRKPKIFVSKSYFLGGAKDSVYTTRLKEFHDKLKEKATTELNEIKQFSALLDSQLENSINKFASLHKVGKLSPAQKKSWNEFNTQWSQIDSQMNETFKKWTPETLTSDFFYGMIYSQVQQSAAVVEKVHGFHRSFYSGSVDSKSFEIQIGEAISQAQAALSALKAKIDTAEKIPPTPNGMPRRDGL